MLVWRCSPSVVEVEGSFDCFVVSLRLWVGQEPVCVQSYTDLSLLLLLHEMHGFNRIRSICSTLKTARNRRPQQFERGIGWAPDTCGGIARRPWRGRAAGCGIRRRARGQHHRHCTWRSPKESIGRARRRRMRILAHNTSEARWMWSTASPDRRTPWSKCRRSFWSPFCVIIIKA